jgi:formylmethanofuran dehydrogenase subunit E
MKFKIEIDCDNEAFQNGQLTDELHLILHRIIHDLPNDIDAENPEFSRNLRDTNGNHVGFVELIEEKAKADANFPQDVAYDVADEEEEGEEENAYILCEKCQESAHFEDALFVQGKYVCLSCWR